MMRLRAIVLALVLGCALVPLASRPAAADSICQGPVSSAPINISSAVTTQVVALSASTVIYVCNFVATLNGTTPAVQFEYGTGALCATGTNVLTGTMAPTTGSSISGGAGAIVQFQTPPGNALCIVSTGTAPSIQGYLTYVQR